MDSKTDDQRPHEPAGSATDPGRAGPAEPATRGEPVTSAGPVASAEAPGRVGGVVPGRARGWVATLVGTAASLLVAGVLTVLLRGRPGGLTLGLLVGALGAAAVAGVLVAVRGVLGATAAAPRAVAPARPGALRAAGFLALTAALLAGGAGVSAALGGRPGGSAKESLAVSYEDGPDGAGGLLVVHARVAGLDPGTPWRADLFRRADGTSAVPAFRAGVVPADGVLVVEMRQLAPGAEDLTLRLGAAPVSCVAPIRFSSVGAVPELRCSGRRTGR